MGETQSRPVYDDGHSNVHQDHYDVIGELRASKIKADVISCERLYVDKLKADKVQLCEHIKVDPPHTRAFADRTVKADHLTVSGTIYAGHVKCDRLRAYKVYYTDATSVEKTEVMDRNSINPEIMLQQVVQHLQGGQQQGGQHQQGGQYQEEPPPYQEFQDQGHAGPPGHQQQFVGGPPPPAPYGGVPSQAKWPETQGSCSGMARGMQMCLDRDMHLRTEFNARDGRWIKSSFTLNAHVTNDDGHLKWVDHAYGNFMASSREPRLSPDGKMLIAQCCCRDGTWRESGLVLEERITNENGSLTFA